MDRWIEINRRKKKEEECRSNKKNCTRYCCHLQKSWLSCIIGTNFIKGPTPVLPITISLIIIHVEIDTVFLTHIWQKSIFTYMIVFVMRLSSSKCVRQISFRSKDGNVHNGQIFLTEQ